MSAGDRESCRVRDLSCSFPLLLCLLPVEGTGRKQPWLLWPLIWGP